MSDTLSKDRDRLYILQMGRVVASHRYASAAVIVVGLSLHPLVTLFKSDGIAYRPASVAATRQLGVLIYCVVGWWFANSSWKSLASSMRYVMGGTAEDIERFDRQWKHLVSYWQLVAVAVLAAVGLGLGIAVARAVPSVVVWSTYPALGAMIFVTATAAAWLILGPLLVRIVVGRESSVSINRVDPVAERAFSELTFTFSTGALCASLGCGAIVGLVAIANKELVKRGWVLVGFAGAAILAMYTVAFPAATIYRSAQRGRLDAMESLRTGLEHEYSEDNFQRYKFIAGRGAWTGIATGAVQYLLAVFVPVAGVVVSAMKK